VGGGGGGAGGGGWGGGGGGGDARHRGRKYLWREVRCHKGFPPGARSTFTSSLSRSVSTGPPPARARRNRLMLRRGHSLSASFGPPQSLKYLTIRGPVKKIPNHQSPSSQWREPRPASIWYRDLATARQIRIRRKSCAPNFAQSVSPPNRRGDFLSRLSSLDHPSDRMGVERHSHRLCPRSQTPPSCWREVSNSR